MKKKAVVRLQLLVYVPKLVTETVFVIALIHIFLGIVDVSLLKGLFSIYLEILKVVIDFFKKAAGIVP